MAIIIDLKNAIRKAIYDRDKGINFYFDEMLRTQFPYVFFYIPSYKLDSAICTDYWRKLTLLCVIEYEKEEKSSSADLWSYADVLADTYKLFDFADTKLRVENPEFKTVNGVLQMTFNFEFYVKQEDTTELMEYLNLTLKGVKNG